MKTDAELKTENPELYKVAREGGTEARFVGEYVNTKDDGIYHCAVCDASLFDADTKFESKSGWPAFTDVANSDAVTLHEDNSHGMKRTEVRCRNCDAHLGHMWKEGAYGIHDATGKTCDYYCINSISLDLKDK